MSEVGRSPASSRVTITDIAERAGVSIGAVSFALNGRKGVSDQTRERVLKVAEDLGWAPASAAKSLAASRTETFGMVLARDPKNLGLESFYMQFLAGLEAELAERSFGLLLQVVPTVEDEVATIKKWRNARRVDGIILVDVRVDDPRVRLALAANALPTVVVGDPSVAGGLTSVWTDDAASMREAVRHLAELGHRRIARVSGLDFFAHTKIRDDAFIDEMNGRDLAAVILRTDYSPESGAGVSRQALQSPDRPTAFIYDNDVMAVAGVTVAMERGLSVPRDVSIIAWDDSVLCEHTFPAMTALSHDVIAFGSHVARRLFDVVGGAAPQAFLDSTPHLRVRRSTGPAAS